MTIFIFFFNVIFHSLSTLFNPPPPQPAHGFPQSRYKSSNTVEESVVYYIFMYYVFFIYDTIIDRIVIYYIYGLVGLDINKNHTQVIIAI